MQFAIHWTCSTGLASAAHGTGPLPPHRERCTCSSGQGKLHGCMVQGNNKMTCKLEQDVTCICFPWRGQALLAEEAGSESTNARLTLHSIVASYPAKTVSSICKHVELFRPYANDLEPAWKLASRAETLLRSMLRRWQLANTAFGKPM